MPAYDYEIPELGQTITLIRPVERRDDPVEVRRVQVPQSIAIAGTAANPFDPEAQMRAGWRKLEERGKLPPHMRARLNQARSIVDRPLTAAEA